MNKKDLAVLGVIVVVSLGLGFVIPHPQKAVIVSSNAQQQVLGAAASPDYYNPEYFHNGLYANQFYNMGYVTASSTSATTTEALGSSSVGLITLGTSTPNSAVTFYASSTAITASSIIDVVPTSVAPPGVTCNSAAPTGILTAPIFISNASSSLNGFSVLVATAPSTHPFCVQYQIINPVTFK